jgi:hypothetical protein
MASIKRARAECLRLSVLGKYTAAEFQSLRRMRAVLLCVLPSLELRALSWSINNNKSRQGTEARAKNAFSP